MNCIVSICVIKKFRPDFPETKYSDGKGKKYQSGYDSVIKRARPGSFFATKDRKNEFLAISRFRVVSFKDFVPFGFKYSFYSQTRS